MRYGMILIKSKRGDEDILCLQVILDLLFVIIAPIDYTAYLVLHRWQQLAVETAH